MSTINPQAGGWPHLEDQTMAENVSRHEWLLQQRYEGEIRADLKKTVGDIADSVKELREEFTAGIKTLADGLSEVSRLQREANSKVAAHSVVIEEMARRLTAVEQMTVPELSDALQEVKTQADTLQRDGCDHRADHAPPQSAEEQQPSITIRWSSEKKRAVGVGGVIGAAATAAAPYVWEGLVWLMKHLGGHA